MSRHIAQPRIVTTYQWGAVPAKAPPVLAGQPWETLFHHTAGHHPEISLPRDESPREAYRYARDIQHFHMAPKPHGRDWNDSGHNFLVCRNGMILVGRHDSLTEVKKGRMVVSAHCPGHNTQPGIEHEHLGDELMTPAQFRSSVHLHAWIIDVCRMKDARVIRPHSQYFATSCPGRLLGQLPELRSQVDALLRALL